MKETVFTNSNSDKLIHYPKYGAMYASLKPDFSSISSEDNREEIESSIINYQDKYRFFNAEIYLTRSMGLESMKTDSVDYENRKKDFIRNIDWSFYDNMTYGNVEKIEECDTLADKFINRIIVIQWLKQHCPTTGDIHLKNELYNFGVLGMLIRDYFVSAEILRYMELVDRDKDVKRHTDYKLFQQMSSFVNFYLSETEEYNKLYNEIMNKKNKGKQLKKTLVKPNQQ